jgi:hypothetical protein
VDCGCGTSKPCLGSRHNQSVNCPHDHPIHRAASATSAHLAKPGGGRRLLVALGSVWCLLLPLGLRNHVCRSDCERRNSSSLGCRQNAIFSCGRFYLVDVGCQSAAIIMVFAPSWTALFADKKPSILIICASAAPSLGRSGLVSYTAAVGKAYAREPITAL